MMNANQQKFIDKILPGAKKAQDKLGVFVSLTLAQAVLESGWGRSSIGNNIFGIKANAAWKGAKKLVKTTEYVGGKRIETNAFFRDYASVEDSIEDHAKLLTIPRYKPVIQAKGYKEACKQVQKCGYATDPNYTNKLILLIETYGLNKWDKTEVKPLVKDNK